MGKTSYFNDAVFAAIAAYHLATRQWPFGGVWQSVIDALLGISALLIAFKYVVTFKKGGFSKKNAGKGRAARRRAVRETAGGKAGQRKN